MCSICFGFWLCILVVVCVSGDFTFIDNNRLELNDKCTAERTQQSGICKFIDDCPRIKDESLKSFFPTLCGFVQGQEMVCCPYETDDVIQLKVSTESKPLRISAQSMFFYF